MDFTTNLDLYKWNKVDPKVDTITEMSNNADKIDGKFGDIDTKLEGIYNVKWFGAKGDGATDDTAAIQNALDTIDGTLYFPPGNYIVTGTGEACLYVTRNVSILGFSSYDSLIRGDNLGAATDVIQVSISENSGALDIRNWFFKNMRVRANGNGRHALYIDNDTDSFPIFSSEIKNNNLSGYETNGGYSIYVDNNLAHSEISFNTIQSEIYMKCRDANVIRKNTFFGERVGITYDVIYGVHNNTVEDNTIVNRDGAVHIINGDAIRIRNNQIELASTYGLSQSPTSSHVWVEGRDRISYNVLIEDNNFGGGTNLDHLMYIDNAQKTVITKNQFVSTNIAEVYFTANAKYNVLKRDNYTRGTTSNPRTRTAFKEEVVDNGEGNAGVLKSGTLLSHQNGWTGGDFYKDENGTIHFFTQISGGTTASGTTIGTLPAGFRPSNNLYIPCGTSSGIGNIKITSGAGVISAAQAIPSNAGVTIQSFPTGTTD